MSEVDWVEETGSEHVEKSRKLIESKLDDDANAETVNLCDYEQKQAEEESELDLDLDDAQATTASEFAEGTSLRIEDISGNTRGLSILLDTSPTPIVNLPAGSTSAVESAIKLTDTGTVNKWDNSTCNLTAEDDQTGTCANANVQKSEVDVYSANSIISPIHISDFPQPMESTATTAVRAIPTEQIATELQVTNIRAAPLKESSPPTGIRCGRGGGECVATHIKDAELFLAEMMSDFVQRSRKALLRREPDLLPAGAVARNREHLRHIREICETLEFARLERLARTRSRKFPYSKK